MASNGNDCTRSGSQLWVATACIGLAILLIVIVELTITLASKPDLTEEILTAISLIGLGTIVGLSLLHQGLTNGEFLMSMRVTLVIIGFTLAIGGLLSGLQQVLFLS